MKADDERHMTTSTWRRFLILSGAGAGAGFVGGLISALPSGFAVWVGFLWSIVGFAAVGSGMQVGFASYLGSAPRGVPTLVAASVATGVAATILWWMSSSIVPGAPYFGLIAICMLTFLRARDHRGRPGAT